VNSCADTLASGVGTKEGSGRALQGRRGGCAGWGGGKRERAVWLRLRAVRDAELLLLSLGGWVLLLGVGCVGMMFGRLRFGVV